MLAFQSPTASGQLVGWKLSPDWGRLIRKPPRAA